MQIFEFHFNPKLKEDLVFDSFCYEPENIYEKRLGNLYVIGLLKNSLPKNLHLFDDLAAVLKSKFYNFKVKSSEQSLKESLKQANEFFEGLVKEGDVNWLGNINLAVLSLKDFELNFTRVGGIKILLLREGRIFDIGKNLNLHEIEPYPLKVFGNIISGKLVENDKILILTQDVFDFLSSTPREKKTSRTNKSVLSEIAELPSFNERNLKEVFQKREKEFKNIAGVCLVLDLEGMASEISPTAVIFQDESEKFSISKTFSRSLKTIKNLLFKIINVFVTKFLGIFKISRPKISIKKEIPKITIKPTVLKQKIEKKLIYNLKNLIFAPNSKRNIILVSALILVILAGFLIFRTEEKRKLMEYQVNLDKIEAKLTQGENLLNARKEKEAFLLLKEARQEILNLLKEENSLKSKSISLKESIENDLLSLSKYEKINDPKLFVEFNPKEFIPQKIVFYKNNLYFYSPFSENLVEVNQKSEKNIIKINQKFNLATPYNNSILFFKKPELLFSFENGQFAEPFSLKPPYPDFSFSDISSFHLNLYFLESKEGKIIKYSYPLFQGKDYPQLWLGSETEKLSNPESIAIDGSIWILKQNNTIDRYYGGNIQETLTFDFFPYPKDFTKIFITLQSPYLYLLEPVQNRVIILNKQGDIVKQFQSPKFDALMDLSVSDDGKTIYLLSGSKVYQIPF